MVSLRRRGWFNWLVQRISALVIVCFIVFLGTYIGMHHLTYSLWHQLWQQPLMKGLGIVVWCAIAWHAWIGLWTVLTDYVKPPGLQRLLCGLVCLALIFYVVWGVWCMGSL